MSNPPDAQRSPSSLWSVLNERLGLSNFMYGIPAHANSLPYALGGITAALFCFSVISGIVLMAFSGPVEVDVVEPTIVSVIRHLHYWLMVAILVLLALHAVRVYLTRAYRRPREANWIIGVTLGSAMALFGVVFRMLDWIKNETPEVAAQRMEPIKNLFGGWLTGIQGAPLNFRAYDAHVVILPLLVVGLLVAHAYLVKVHGISGRKEGESEQPFASHLRPILTYTGIVLVVLIILSIVWQFLSHDFTEGIEVPLGLFPILWAYAVFPLAGATGVFIVSVLFYAAALLIPIVLDRGESRTLVNTLMAALVIVWGIGTVVGFFQLHAILILA